MSTHHNETPWWLIAVRSPRAMTCCCRCEGAAAATTAWLRGGEIAVVELCAVHFREALGGAKSKAERVSVAAMLTRGRQPRNVANSRGILDRHEAVSLAVTLGG